MFDTGNGARVNTISLGGTLSVDAAPDLMDIAPAGNRYLHVAARSQPVERGSALGHWVTPGLGIIRVEQGGRSGVLQAIIRISNVDQGGVERADAHSVGV